MKQETSQMETDRNDQGMTGDGIGSVSHNLRCLTWEVKVID